MSGWEISALVLAGALAVSVLAATFLVVVRLRRTVDQLTRTVEQLTAQTVPLLGEVTTSVTHVNKELVRVDAITANVQSMTGNVSALTSLFAATLGSPVVKVAAFSYGVRRAASRRHESDVNKRVRAELKGERKGRR